MRSGSRTWASFRSIPARSPKTWRHTSDNPGADERAVATLEARAHAMPPVTKLIAQGADAHALLHALAGDLDLRSHRTVDVRFACLCTREKVEVALLGMGGEELRRLAAELPETEATCEFCKKLYVFTSDEVIALANQTS
jgi:molecular chaperone Hsp33